MLEEVVGEMITALDEESRALLEQALATRDMAAIARARAEFEAEHAHRRDSH